ncbi:CopG family ribbon-helix-helix protein [Caenispirillum salinarum]|uniref:CopG family ribbon-helix-helix protein n=1 Tax=Caenispirillum salinarum TaxID=859058 RepID=UPI00384C77A8
MPQTKVEGYVDEATKAVLAEMSRAGGRSVEDIVSEAVADYAAWHAEKMRRIQRGLKDIDEGRLVSEEEMDAFFDDWIKNG